MKSAIQETDWIKFLERKRLFFSYLAFLELERRLLPKVTGFEYKHHLYIYQNKTGTMFRSKKELEETNRYFLNIIENKDKRLDIWRELAIRYNEEADSIIDKFKDKEPQEKINYHEFEELYEKALLSYLYGTTIPYLLLSAVDAISEDHRTKEMKKAIKDFDKFRGITKYPQVEETFMTYFWKYLAKKYKIEDYILFSYLTPKELRSILKEDTKPKIEELEKRRKWCVFWNNTEREEVEFSYDKDIINRIPILKEKEELKISDTIRGNIAFKGKITGRVSIVNYSDDMKKVKEGDIIVSICTNPTLMPVLKKCSAIVTDEGGIMCHAAIVSRELKKPCIIGTKIASKVLKDGDLIEVDAEKGIIKILK